jgi:peptidoglycan/xylan/chitin deacetylase (PgdA/CDA1 family)
MLVKGRKSSSPRLALTFDDGPHQDNTKRLLDILDRNAAPATFFLQGSEVEKHPELAREILGRGHQIGNHGYSHFDAKRTSRHLYLADTNRAQDILQDALGTALQKIFRPPHGTLTAAALLILVRSGYRIVLWSADSRDSFIRSPRELVSHVASLRVADGDILLFHEDYAHTLASLPEVLRLIRERSLHFARIKDL